MIKNLLKKYYLLFLVFFLLFSCTKFTKLNPAKRNKNPSVILYYLYAPINQYVAYFPTGKKSLNSVAARYAGMDQDGKLMYSEDLIEMQQHGDLKHAVITYNEKNIYSFKSFYYTDGYLNVFVNLDQLEFLKNFPFPFKPGGINFMGILTFDEWRSEVRIVDGFEYYENNKHKFADLKNFEKNVFGKYERTRLGAYKNILDQFIDTQEGYWKKIAEDERSKI